MSDHAGGPKEWADIVSLDKLEQAQNEAIAMVDAMAPKDPAPLRHPLAGPFVRLAKHDPPVALQLGQSPSGKLICTGLLVGWQLNAIGDAGKLPMSERTELTARAVHRIKLGTILDDLARLEGAKRRRTASSGAGPVPDWLYQTVPRPAHPGPKGHTDEWYRHVAETYQEALVVAPGSPMKWLQQQLPCSPAQSYRYRDEAAARGFLSTQPKARRGPPDNPRGKRSR